MFVLIEVGCLECQKGSALVGVFPDYASARVEAERLEDAAGECYPPQYSYDTFEVPAIMGIKPGFVPRSD